jgi:hypothetical protein
VNQLLAAYQALFATWQAENAKQQQIINQSEQSPIPKGNERS